MSYQWEHQLCTEQQRLPRKQALDSLQLQTDAALHKSRRRVECFPQRCIIVRCVSRTSLVRWPCQNLDVTKPETRDMLGACVNCEESGDNSPSTSELSQREKTHGQSPGSRLIYGANAAAPPFIILLSPTFQPWALRRLFLRSRWIFPANFQYLPLQHTHSEAHFPSCMCPVCLRPVLQYDVEEREADT